MTESKQQQPACSICGKPVDPAYKPFCSKRCANLDLHRWLNGAYAIAGEPVEEEPQAGEDSRGDEG
jgi:uncharacterized protein